MSTATAPASSGNLGPGFDCLGLALELRCRVEAEPADTWLIEELGDTFEPRQEDFVRLAVDAAVGRPMRLAISNAIPRSRGLGSSAAVMTASAAAAFRATGREPGSDELFEIVATVEGHGDNAAATVYGGLTAVSGHKVLHLEIAPTLVAVVGVPDQPLKTREARRVLPRSVPLAVAARTIARVAFLVDGLRTGNPAVLADAGGDEIHEGPRAQLSSLTGTLIEAARDAGALHAAWSGAGPTAIALTADPAPVAAAMTDAIEGRGKVMVLEVARAGWA